MNDLFVPGAVDGPMQPSRLGRGGRKKTGCLWYASEELDDWQMKWRGMCKHVGKGESGVGNEAKNA